MPENYPDDEAKAILSRAIELDLHAAWVTRQELHAIAAELGVSAPSLELALREHEAKIGQGQRSRPSFRAGTRLGLGISLGAAAVLLAELTPAGPIAGLALVASGVLASYGMVIREGRAVTLRSVYQKMSTLWAGFAAGGLLGLGSMGTLEGLSATGFLTISLWSWVASCVMGTAAVVAVKGAYSERESDSGSPAGFAASVRSGLVRTVRRLVDRVRVSLHRMVPMLPVKRSARSGA